MMMMIKMHFLSDLPLREVDDDDDAKSAGRKAGRRGEKLLNAVAS